MSSFVVYSIKETDYPAFKSLLGSRLPDDFNLWRHEQRNRVIHHGSGGTNEVKVQEISPSRFAAWCRAAGHIPEIHLMDEYARSLAS